MSESAHDRLEHLFLAALARPAEERDAFLDEACAGDASLRARLGRLLEAHVAAGDFLARPEPPTVELPGLGDARQVQGRRIGNYTVQRVIAAGGMGVVYEAVQDEPMRTVALKVMKSGIASPSAMRRFQHEAEILGRLQHPAIAQIYEAGTHDDGSGPLPFFAMEYVRGAKTIVEYARDEQLSVRERLDLFEQVCAAVQHGHEQGIIHRDLKPGNILVGARGRPKVIDFGVARVTDADIAVTTVYTAVGQIIGTLQYMSPEQCAGDPDALDTRSDIYALGVVLYEMLCGRPPYDLARIAVHEAARVIREEPPSRPSTVNRTIRGDVETITLKALEKDRARRYQSVAAMSEDIRRYLSDQPILARPPGPVHRAALFLRRRRRTVLAAALIVAAMLTGLLVARPGPPEAALTVIARTPDGVSIDGALVSARRVDVTSRLCGEAVPIGTTPLRDASLPPGYYRVVIDAGAAGFAEAIRHLRADRAEEVAATIRPTAVATAGMVRIDSAPATIGLDAKSAGLEEFARRRVTLPAFWIDRTEISNDAYQAFLDATGRRAPAFWGAARYPEGWADLPVTGVSWHDAVAYAEWAGKRLPTKLEWERAARGTEGRSLPWGEDRSDMARFANVATSDPHATNQDFDDPEYRRYYAGHATAVGTLTEGSRDRTPEGLLHMTGNVAEWTESMHFDLAEGEDGIHPGERIWMGFHWSKTRREPAWWTLEAFNNEPLDNGAIGRGFRCAKSATP